MEYFRPVLRRSWDDAWSVFFAAPKVNLLALVAVWVLSILLQGGKWSSVVNGVRGLVWTLLATAIVFIVIFLVHLLYLTPKRLVGEVGEKLDLAEDRVERVTVERDRLLVKANEPQPIFAALDELERLIGAGETFNGLFQLSDVPNHPPTPSWTEVTTWQERVEECVNRSAFCDYIDANDRARFRERWPAGHVKRAIAAMQRFGYLVSSSEQDIYRHFWGKLQRLKELVEAIKAGPKGSETRKRFDQSQAQMEECLQRCASLLKKDCMQVLWSMNALFIASADKLHSFGQVAWVCQGIGEQRARTSV
jgi:hypothetical protein